MYEQTAIYLIWLGLIISVVITFAYIVEYSFNIVTLRFGQYGELIGGIVGSIWALAGVILFYDSMNNQREEMKIQRVELGFQRQVMIEQNSQIKKQNETIELQTIENTFFQLINLHTQIVSSIDIDLYKTDSNGNNSSISKLYGRDCFIEFYQIFKRVFNASMEKIWFDDLEGDTMKQLVSYSFRQFFDEYQATLGHYFRNIFIIISYVDGKEQLKQNFYVNLIKAQLSNFELNLLYFYGLSDLNLEFKRLSEKYGMFNKVANDELIEITKDLYEASAFE